VAPAQTTGAGKLARLQPSMALDQAQGRVLLLHEDLHLSAVITNPDLLPEILGGHVIKGLGNLHVSVALHREPALLETGKQASWQWQKEGLLGFEMLTHLPLGRAVNASVSHVGFPMKKHLVELLQ